MPFMRAHTEHSPWALFDTCRFSIRATGTPQLTCLRNARDSTGSNMLFLYVSLHSPSLIALLDLPISTSQRSSLWSRRTRRELRILARSLVIDNLQNRQCVEPDRNGDSRVTIVRHEKSERYSADRDKAKGEWYM